MIFVFFDTPKRLLGFPAILTGIPDEFSTMLMQCVLKILVSFKLSLVSFPLFSMIIFSYLKKLLFVRKGLTLFQNDLVFIGPRLFICSK